MPYFGRFGSLDALRGLAVFLMFLNHFTEYLMINPSDSDAFAVVVIFTRLSAPLFIFVSGFSLVYSLRKRQASSGDFKAVRHSVSRGLLLILLGFLLSLLLMNPAKLNILYTIGLSLIMFPYLALKPNIGRCVLSVCLIYLISQAAFSYSPSEAVLSVFDFPPLPWSVFFALGIAAAGFSMKQGIERTARVFELTAVASILSAALFLSLGDKFAYHGNCSISFIASMSTIIFFILASAIWVYEVYRKNPLVLTPLRVYGQHALFLYFIQYILVVTLPKLAGLENTFSFEATVSSLLLFLVISFLALKNRG
jgi:uncharacterized membrane protein